MVFTYYYMIPILDVTLMKPSFSQESKTSKRKGTSYLERWLQNSKNSAIKPSLPRDLLFACEFIDFMIKSKYIFASQRLRCSLDILSVKNFDTKVRRNSSFTSCKFSKIVLISGWNFLFCRGIIVLFFSVPILSWVVKFLKNILSFSLKQELVYSHQSRSEEWLFCLLLI